MKKRLPKQLLRSFSAVTHTYTIYSLRFRSTQHTQGHSLWLALFSLWGMLIAPASFGQSLQWSQLVGHISPGSSLFSSRAFPCLYILGNLRKPNHPPVFQTTDGHYVGSVHQLTSFYTLAWLFIQVVPWFVGRQAKPQAPPNIGRPLHLSLPPNAML